MRLVALLTVHNRRDTTARCLELLDVACGVAGVELTRIVVDDGSTDGTAELLATVRRPGDIVVRGSGDLYWAGGMRRAWAELPSAEPFDHVLLLNDDTVLLADGVATLLEPAGSRTDRLVVGRLVDPVSGETTYGGYAGATRWRPLSFVLQSDAGAGLLDGMNANAVLVGAAALRQLGGLSTSFRHGFADFDYALRARRRGLQVLLSPRPVGTCARNPVADTWRDPALPRRVRVRLMREPKGQPPGEWAVFCWRHGRLLGLPYFLWPCRELLRPGSNAGSGTTALDRE